MKIVVLYRPESEFARAVEEFAHDIERQQNVKPELISIDTREGANMAETYDITDYPAILATRESGEVLQMWIGPVLPLMNEVAAYANS
jgi:hypothetical protein